MNLELTPHELLAESYPAAAQCISSLREIIKVNPELATEALELAVLIGINSAYKRMKWDELRDKVDLIKARTTSSW